MENFTASDWINVINERQLSSQERERLNNRLENDEDFREEFIFLQTARAAVLEKEREKWRMFYNEENKPRRISYLKWGLAASVLFLMISGWWYFQAAQFDNPQEIYAEYAENPIMGKKSRGGDSESNQYLAQAEKDFNEEKYEASVKNFDRFFIYNLYESILSFDSTTTWSIDTVGLRIYSMVDSTSLVQEIRIVSSSEKSDNFPLIYKLSNLFQSYQSFDNDDKNNLILPIRKPVVFPKVDYKIHLNRAMALRNSIELKKAIAAFKFLAEKEVFRDEIDWQLALTYLKMNDLPSSKSILDKIIASGEHDYLEDAKQLKKEINRLPK